MKYSELAKLLRQSGCSRIDEGANHETWINAQGDKFYVPRHKTHVVPIGTYSAIMKQAGLK